ncbi:hypothetical protein ACFL0O_03135 [Thermodesulfobacteriota bacterium]
MHRSLYIHALYTFGLWELKRKPLPALTLRPSMFSPHMTISPDPVRMIIFEIRSTPTEVYY